MNYIQERAEIDLLTKKGFTIKTPVRSFLRIFKKKERVWRVKWIPLGLMDYQTDLFFQLRLNENKLYSDDAEVRNDEIMNSVKDNVRLCAEIVAISILGYKIPILLFRKIFARYLLWRINSGELFEFTKLIFKMNDFENFTTSIALLRAKRTTLPLNPEKTEEKTEAQTIELSQPTD